MALFDNPLIPFDQQAPSGIFTVTAPVDPLDVPELYTYWNAQVDNSLFQDTASATAVTAAGQDVQAWKEITNTVNSGTEPTNPPSYGTDGTIKWVEFQGETEPKQGLVVSGSQTQFEFMHNGDGGEIIVVAEIPAPTGNGQNLIVNNNSGSPRQTGFSVSVGNASAPPFNTGTYRFFVSVAAGASDPGGTVTLLRQEAGAYAYGPPHTFQGNYKASATPISMSELDNINVGIEGGDGLDPVGDPSQINLHFGAVVFTSTLGLTGKIFSIAIFDSELSEVNRRGVACFLAGTAGFTVNTDDIPLYPIDTGYADFDVTDNEIFYTHENLPLCTQHSITVSGNPVIITFYAGETVSRVETLTETGVDYNIPGVTKIGYKTTSGTATARSWSR